MKEAKKKAFDYLMEKKGKRTSDNAKGKPIIYHEFAMADYLCPSDEEIAIEKKYGYLNAGLKISMSKEFIDGNILTFHVFHAKKE